MRCSLYKLIVASVLCLVSVGCVHNYDVKATRNGLPVSRTQGAVGFRSSSSQTDTYDALMPTCIAHVGKMQNGEEEVLCAKKTRAIVNQETYPYGFGYGVYYGPNANPYGYYPPAGTVRPYP